MNKGNYIIMSLVELAILIPCYNEEQTINKVILDFKSVLPEATIYVYDNNSSDNTAKIAQESGAIVKYEYRQGKGNVIRSMFREVEADCYLMIDGDDTYPAEYARKMCDMVLSGKADMVIGDRLSSTYFEENKRPFHNVGNILVRKFINTFFASRENIDDVMTGYRAFSPLFVKSFPVLSQGFEIETEMTIHALDKNLLVTSIPVAYRDRPEGSESKLNTFSDGFKVLFTIFNLYRQYKPFRFFGFVALLLFLISMVLFISVFIDYIETGLVMRQPTLVVSMFLLLSSLMSFVAGIILDVQVKHSHQNFEIQLNMISMMLKNNK